MSKTPILAVEVTRLSSAYRDSGVALYIKHILQGLSTQKGLRTVCFGKEIADQSRQELPSETEYHLSRGPAIIWRNQALRAITREYDCQLAWFPFQIVPWLPCMPFVCTLHDYGFLRFRGVGMSLTSCLYLSLCLGNALWRSKWLLCVSEATRLGVLQRFPWAKGKIILARHGLPEEVRKRSARMEPLFFEKPTQFFRCVFLAGENERKRFDLALQACERVCRETALELVVTGPEEKVKTRAQKVLGFVPSYLRCVGRLSRSDLLDLYQKSHALLYWSYFEGFGFPILEALALGAQVLCLPGQAEKEVGGNFVTYTDPATPAQAAKDLLAAFQRVKTRESPLAGISHARSFSWQPSLNAHARVFGLPD